MPLIHLHIFELNLVGMFCSWGQRFINITCERHLRLTQEEKQSQYNNVNSSATKSFVFISFMLTHIYQFSEETAEYSHNLIILKHLQMYSDVRDIWWRCVKKEWLSWATRSTNTLRCVAATWCSNVMWSFYSRVKLILLHPFVSKYT